LGFPAVFSHSRKGEGFRRKGLEKIKHSVSKNTSVMNEQKQIPIESLLP